VKLLNLSTIHYTATFFFVFIIDLSIILVAESVLTTQQSLLFKEILNLVPLAAIVVGIGAPTVILYFRSRGVIASRQLAGLNSHIIVFSSVATIVIWFVFKGTSFSYIWIVPIIGAFAALRQTLVNYFLGSFQLQLVSGIRFTQKLTVILVILLSIQIVSHSGYSFAIALVIGEFIALTLTLKYNKFSFKGQSRYRLKQVRISFELQRYSSGN